MATETKDQREAHEERERAEREQAERAARARGKWIADGFDGCVVIHDVDGESVTLTAGEQIPTGHEDKVGPHIPTTDTKPRSARIRDIDLDVQGDPDPGFQPGEHKVDDVVAFIQANPQHAQRVLDLERAGRNRRSVFDKLGA